MGKARDEDNYIAVLRASMQDVFPRFRCVHASFLETCIVSMMLCTQNSRSCAPFTRAARPSRASRPHARCSIHVAQQRSLSGRNESGGQRL